MRWKAVIRKNKSGKLISITPTKFDFIKTSLEEHHSSTILPDPTDNTKIIIYFTCEDSVIEAVNTAQELYLEYIEGGFNNGNL